MTLALSYIISSLIGFLLIEKITGTSKIISIGLKCALALGLGLGLSGLLTFLTLLGFGHYSPFFLIALHILILITFIIIDRNHIKNTFTDIIMQIKDKSVFDYFALIVFIALTACVGLLAARYPYGGWDGWALWNMKTKFMLLGGKEWKSIFTEIHWHAQPDYPLLLSCINTWLLSFAKTSINKIPFITAIVLSGSTGLLLFTGLKQFIRREIALLAAILMLGNPYYILLSTSQYADILLAFYLLASFLSIALYFKHQDPRLCLLTGIFLGLMTFTKNEGIVLSLILIALMTLHLVIRQLKDKKHLKHIIYLMVAYAAIAAITASFKLFLTPKNPDIVLFASNVEYEFLNLNGLLLILKAFLVQLIHPQWAYIWILILAMFILSIRQYFDKKNILFTLFFLGYCGVIIIIYLTTINFDLAWRLTFTLKRIMFYLLPSVLFFNFKVMFSNNHES